MAIHPTAIISPKANVDPSVEIGPYSIIEDDVTIGPNCRIYPYVHIMAYTTLGANNEVHTGSVLGDLPQDKAFGAQRSFVKIGDDNIFREGVTINRGTKPETTTVIGSRCFLMAQSHVGHNCVVGDDVVMVNQTLIAGYVEVHDRAFLGGRAGIHQFVRIGKLCMIAACAKAVMDVPPFLTLSEEGLASGPNTVGLRRAGMTRDQINDIRQIYRTLYRSGLLFRDAVDKVEQEFHSDVAREMIEFLRAPTKRGFVGGVKNRK